MGVRTYDWLASALPLVSCEVICAEAGLRCAAPRPLVECPDDEGSVYDADGAGVACGVYRGVDSVEVLGGACDELLPVTQGFRGNKRAAVRCFCEGTDPLLEAPLPGGLVPQAGRYQYQTADRELVVIRVETQGGGELYFEVESGGRVAILDSDGEEIASNEDLNFIPAVAAPILPAQTYYLTYRSFPEQAMEITFTVDY